MDIPPGLTGVSNIDQNISALFSEFATMQSFSNNIHLTKIIFVKWIIINGAIYIHWKTAYLLDIFVYVF